MWVRRLRYLLRRPSRERDLHAEMELHIEEKTKELRERGFSESEAYREARLAFGNLLQKQEDSRDVWLARQFSDLWQDLRYAVRRLIAAPGFSIATIVILALGIGANSALFTAIDRTMLRPLPFSNPDRLVALWEDFSAFGSAKNRVSPATYIDWKTRAQTFESMAAYGIRVKNLSEG